MIVTPRNNCAFELEVFASRSEPSDMLNGVNAANPLPGDFIV
jgi:hypothetical protein